MKRHLFLIICLPLISVVVLGAYALGDHNAPKPAPTPAAPPKNAIEWVDGFLTGQITVPSFLMTGGPVKAKVAYSDCGNFEIEGNKDATTFVALVAFAESCGKESDLPQLLQRLGHPSIPVLFKSPVKKPTSGEIRTAGGGDCYVKGSEELARECLAFSANVLEKTRPPDPLPVPTPMPIPEPETLYYEIRGTSLILLAYKGEHVLALVKNPGRKVFLLDQRWVIEPVTYLEDAWVQDGTVHVTYVGADKQYIEFDYPLPAGWTNPEPAMKIIVTPTPLLPQPRSVGETGWTEKPEKDSTTSRVIVIIK